MIGVIHFDMSPEILTIPFINIPLVWYGVLFAAGFFVGYHLFVSLLTKVLGLGDRAKSYDYRKIGIEFADKLTIYVIIGTLIGARLGHILFYESAGYYFSHPWLIFKTWEGGLASHGAVFGILFFVFLFYKLEIKRKWEGIGFLGLLDLLVIPTALVGVFIRMGNLINQEILGKVTSVSWAFVFAHPKDGSFPMPRHPVQIYEALFYLATFAILYAVFKRKISRLYEGQLTSYFFLLVFGFRFFVEFFKEGEIVFHSKFFTLNMAQALSLPMLCIGLFLSLYQMGRKGVMGRTLANISLQSSD